MSCQVRNTCVLDAARDNSDLNPNFEVYDLYRLFFRGEIGSIGIGEPSVFSIDKKFYALFASFSIDTMSW